MPMWTCLNGLGGMGLAQHAHGRSILTLRFSTGFGRA